jgi:hypothetical protein
VGLSRGNKSKKKLKRKFILKYMKRGWKKKKAQTAENRDGAEA